MTRYIITSIILPLLFLLQTNAQNTTTVSGTINNPNHFSISFQWENDLVSGILKESVIALNGANEFRSDIAIDKPSVVNIKYGDKTKELFLEPGDNLELNFNANQFEYSCSFSGKGSENNKLLDYFQREYGKYDDNFFVYEMAHKKNEEFRTYMDGVHKKMWDFYQKNSLNGISYNFRNYLKSEIDYKWAYNLLRYRFENPKANLQPGPIALPKVYYTFLDKVKVQNPDGLTNQNYHKFIDAYLLYRKDMGEEAVKKFSVSVESNSLTLRAEPKTGEKIGTVVNGQILEYLKERSTETSELFIRGEKTITPWIKVRTPDGQIGWIVEKGIDFVKSADDTSLGSLSKSFKFNNAGKHLKGKVLEYYVAKELHRSVRDNSLPYSKTDFEKFISSVQNPVYKSCIQEDMAKKFGGTLPVSNPVANNSNTPKSSPNTPSTTVANTQPVLRDFPRNNSYTIGISKETQIKGKVNNPSVRIVELVFYKDKFSFEDEALTLHLNPNDEFDLAFDISEPTTAKLIYNNRAVQFFVEPGDKLNLEFDGNKFTSSIKFEGKAGEQNNFLHAFNRNFAKYGENYIYNEIVNKPSNSFKIEMNKVRKEKWTYFQAYDKAAKKQFSKGFSNFIAAEIDYAWALNLLRYHWEHPAANGLTFPMRINANYYDFLGKVMISNDQAIASESYLTFLTLYLKLRETNPADYILSQIKQGVFKSNASREEVYSNSSGGNPITEVFSGEKIKYLNVKSPHTSQKKVNGILRTGNWYQVSTNDGYTGWVFSAAGTLENVKESKTASTSSRYKQVEEEQEVTTTVAVVMVDRLRIRKEPDLPSAVGLASEGEVLTYLGRKSSQRYTFTLRGLTYNDHFYKVETLNGNIGWVFGGGIELEERKSIQKVYKTVPVAETAVKQSSGDTEMYLTGRALYYTKASDLYWKCKGAKPEDIRKDVDKFINSNPYKEYDVAIEEAYNDALRRGTKVDAQPDPDALAAAAEREAKRKQQEAANKKAEDERKRKEQEERLAEQKRQDEIRKQKEELRKKEEAAKIARLEKERLEAEEAALKAKEAADALAEQKARETAARLAQEKLDAEIAAAKAADEVRIAEEKRKRDEDLAEQARIKQEKEDARLAEIERKKQEKADRAQAKLDAAAKKKQEREARLAQKKKDKEDKVAAAKRKKEEETARKNKKPEIGEDAIVLSGQGNTTEPGLTDGPKAPIKENPYELSEEEKCVLDGLAQGIPKEVAEVECAKLYEKIRTDASNVELGIIERKMEEPDTRPKPTRPRPAPVGIVDPYIMLQSIDLTPVEPGKTDIEISGKITNHRNKLAKIILYPDPVSMKEVVFNLYIKADGTFSTKLKIAYPTMGKLQYGSSRIVELYVEPGDDLKVNFDASNFYKTLEFSGYGGNHNNFLRDLKVQFTNPDKEVIGKVYSETNPMSFKKFIKKIYQDKKEFFKISQHQFTYDFTNYAKAHIDYWYAYNLTNYRWENPLNLNQPAPLIIRDNSYYDYLDEIQLNNELALPNEYYVQFLDVYLDDQKVKPEYKGLEKRELADMFLQGKVKYYYQAVSLTSTIRNGTLFETIFEVKTYMDFCTDQSLRETMKSALRESNTMLPGMPAPDFKLKNMKGKEVSLSDFKGKVVYLDFWATWCTPCTRQIANTRELRRKFKGKDVVFIYISTDNTESEWRNYVKNHNLSGVHLYLPDGLGSEVAKIYGAKQLPAAYIIGKNGEIVKNNSMKSTSNYTLSEQLNKQLNK